MLIGKDLIKKYQGREILKGADIAVEPGKITSLIGPSGSGKTTLLRVLSMLDLPDSGSIALDDKNYQFPRDKEILGVWPKISVVFQQLFLWPHLTLRQNILLPLKNNVDKTYIEELIDVLEMREFIDRHPNQASIGQRQRVAIARALALKPQYLLLDEITSSLDVEQVDAVLKYLIKLKDRGMGILIVTHLLNFAQRASDKIVFLDEGGVIETGGKEILENPSHPRIQKFLSIVKSVT
ncbi:MAG: amino acid ABC transporter ATP-binding protein [Candidatus Staskawiczbacteria bacterium]|nr:amino acid ABC transporter ATP-binding protein [Candidatus Staskawiczbacteria bacterium]